MSQSDEITGARTDGQSEVFVRPTSEEHPFLRTQEREPFGQWLEGIVTDFFVQRRFLLAIPILLIASILVWFAQENEPNIFLWGFGLFNVAAIAILVRRRTVLFGLSVTLVVVCAGYSLMNIHRDLFGTQMLHTVRYATVEGRVDWIHSENDTEQRLILGELSFYDAPDWLIVELSHLKRLRLFSRSEARAREGDIVRASVRMYPVPAPVTPYGYDGQVQAFFDGIGAYSTATGDGVEIITQREAGNFFAEFGHWVQGVRSLIGGRLAAVQNLDAQAVLRAMIVGDQSLISDELREEMSKSGLAHVLAISGLHLSLVAGGVFFFVRAVGALSYRVSMLVNLKMVGAIAGLGTAWFYLLLSGASVSAIRATIMLSLIFGAVLVGRRALTLRNVAIAAIIVIMIDPASILRPSFQLSFSAVACLVAVYEHYRGAQGQVQSSWVQRLGAFFGGLFLTSLIAGLATATFAAFHFNNAAPLGPLANLVAVPLAAFLILPASFLGVLLIPFGAEGFAFGVAAQGVEWVVLIAQLVSALEVSNFNVPNLEPSALVFAFLGISGLVLMRSAWRFTPPILAAISIFVFSTFAPPTLLISDSTKAIGVKSEFGDYIVTGRTGSFTTNVWEETYGFAFRQGDGPFTCDDLACIWEDLTSDTKISIVLQQDGFAQDCHWADLIITRLHVPQWCGVSKIDATDLAIHGMHEIYLSPHNEPRILRAIEARNRYFRP